MGESCVRRGCDCVWLIITLVILFFFGCDFDR